MNNPVFGELKFDSGWEKQESIVFFGNEVFLSVFASAYYEQDGITPEQEKAYLDYTAKKTEKKSIIEKLLNEYCSNATKRFTPKTLIFERDGSYALMCDDSEEPDNGIVICLSPAEKIVTQDEYL